MSSDVASFETFFRQLHPSLFAALCLTTRDREEADEIAQEAFVRVLERWDRVSTMDDPAGYLFRTAMNVFLKGRRRTQVWTRLVHPYRDRPDAIAEIDDRDELGRAFVALTPRQRAAVVLVELIGYSSREAGEILGIADSTVRVLVSQARTSIRSTVGAVR